MSPRKTRRGAKADGVNETLLETTMKKSTEISPPTSARTLRTRRQLSKTISQDSEVEDSPQMNKSRKKSAPDTPTSKVTKSRKKAVAAEIISEESSVQEIESTVTKKRGRRVKNNEGAAEQSMLLDNSSANDSRVEKARATRSRKRTTKKEDSKSEDESGEARGGKRKNGIIRKNASVVETDNEILNNSETEEAPMSVEDAEVQRASDKTPRSKAVSVSTPSSERSVAKRRGRHAKTKLEDFTPESSPITVNLSPHRTTKTPRKSPMNFGSPKSRAEQPLRLTKTPRKLPVVGESPAGSEKSIDSSINATPKKSPIHTSASSTKLLNGNSASKKKRTPKIKSSVKSPRKSPSKDIVVRKFSKSPRIVLVTPKAKSPKKKSPRVVASKAKKSPVPKSPAKSPTKSKNPKSPGETSKDGIVEKIVSPAIAKKVKRPASPKKSLTPSSALELGIPEDNLREIESQSNKASPRILKNSSPHKNIKTSDQTSSPMVVLNKMSNVVAVTPEVRRKSSSRKSNNASIDVSLTVTPIKTPSAEKRISQGGESPRRAKSTVKKRTPITDSGTPLRPIGSPRTSSARISTANSIGSEKNTPTETRMTRGKKVEENNVRMLSSTPRERIRRSLNLSPGLGTPLTAVADSPINGRPFGNSTQITEVRANRSLRIEDITNPLISEDDDSISLVEASKKGEETCLDGTFEIAKKNTSNTDEIEEEKIADGTYELIEPKTPVLRRKAAKRSIAEIDTSTDERITKRLCRVRFASPPPNPEAEKPLGSRRAKSATPGPRVNGRRFTPGSSKVTVPRKIGDRKRSNSLSDVPVLKTPVASAKRRSNSTTEANLVSASKSAQIASVNRLSKPRPSIHQSNKKTETKTPLARKAPNFAQIHQKKFAQMESLVDAKKRVERRHLAISTQIPTSLSKVKTAARSKPKMSPKSSAPSVPVNGVYNRYGFKLRKNDAIKIVSQKQPALKSQTKQSENRTLLKGVRTNRRFDLIMKARNINQ